MLAQRTKSTVEQKEVAYSYDDTNEEQECCHRPLRTHLYPYTCALSSRLGSRTRQVSAVWDSNDSYQSRPCRPKNGIFASETCSSL